VADPGRLSVVVYSLAKRQGDGSILIGAKAIEGMKLYAPYWPGGRECLEILVRDAADEQVPDMDAASVRPEMLPFTIRFLGPDLIGQVAQLRDSAVVAMGIEDAMLPLARAMTDAGVPVVLVSEYNRKSLLQMAGFSSRNPLVQWRRKLWVLGYDRRWRPPRGGGPGRHAQWTPNKQEKKEKNPNTHQ
jgi:hypothetical protein